MQASRAASGAKVEGIDLEASGQILPDWNIGASYTHFTTKGRQRQPHQHQSSAQPVQALHHVPPAGRPHRLTVGGGVDWQSRMYQAAASPRGNVEVEQDSYALVSLMARFDFNKKLSATLNVNNLFDKSTTIRSASTARVGGVRHAM